GRLFKAIASQTLVLKSEDAKLKPFQTAVFLSRQTAAKFAARPSADRDDRPWNRPDGSVAGAAATGLEVRGRPAISAQRRYLRLRISQKTTELSGVEKASWFNPFSGKEEKTETAQVGERSVAGTVQLPDGHPILMPVALRPPKTSDNKVWLLLARPFIWIDD